MTNIKTRHIPYSRQWIDDTDIQAVTDALKNDLITQGPKLKEFEQILQNYLEVKHAIIFPNGTAALHLAVRALIKNQNTLGITSPVTFAASANCFLYNNLHVLFTDVHSDTGLMDVTSLESTLSKIKSDAIIIPVSLEGRVPNLPLIYNLAKKHQCSVIEDAAHSLGGSYCFENKKYKSASCSHSDIAILSFHPLKHICSGEGGAILTHDDAIAKKIRLLANHGIHRPINENSYPSWFYEQIDLGWNYRVNELQASLGLSQFKKLPFFISERRRRATIYNRYLSQEPFSSVFTISPLSEDHAYHLYVIHFKDFALRDKAHKFLLTKNIYTQVHYRPIYQFPYYEKHFGKQFFQGAENYTQSCLSIPLFPKMLDEEQEYVIESLKEFCYLKHEL